MKKSLIYVGEISHRRMTPKRHHFSYNVCYYYLDLDEVKSIFKFPFFLSYNFPGLLSFWRKDYLGNSSQDLKQTVLNLIQEKTHQSFTGSVRMLTNISYFGHCFNPVTFYYCFDKEENLKFVISEITNTPWNERHSQVFPIDSNSPSTFKFNKEFHVSPFMPMAMDYTWIFHSPDERLEVLMQNRLKGESHLFFDSTLSLKSRPLNTKNVLTSFITFPFMTFKTGAAIYYQALVLFLKKIPFYTHPPKGESA